MRAYLLVFSLLFSTNLFAATYELTFNGIWNANQVQPGTYPGNAHFSPVVGTTHTQGTAFWQRGGIASPGVEGVAENGGVDAMLIELSAAKQAGTAGDFFSLEDQFNLPQSETIRIEVDNDKAFLSLITMIAPSPDWFIGVSGLELRRNGQWLENITAEMRPYDAGTEAGTAFSLNNAATPGGSITLLGSGESPFVGSPVIATVELRLIAPLPVRPPVTPPAPPSNTQTPVISGVLGLLL